MKQKMILLIDEDKLGDGCASCRFLDKSSLLCTVDERVNVIDKEQKVNKYRPYTCPFMYYDNGIQPIVKCFDGMTEEETKGWFEGADYQVKRYLELEDQRDAYAEWCVRTGNRIGGETKNEK